MITIIAIAQKKYIADPDVYAPPEKCMEPEMPHIQRQCVDMMQTNPLNFCPWGGGQHSIS